jgi:cytochrome c oxidase cbb3-type subunit III
MTPDRNPDTTPSPDASKPPTKDRLLEHAYDGIQEYDNPMPRWWLVTFAGTVIFSILYLFNIGPIGNGKGRIADYNADMAAFAATHKAPAGGSVSAEALLALTTNKDALHEGKEVFTKNCVACHRADAGGLIGPNLTDNYWIHGGKITDIYQTVTTGVLDKGMPPWGKMLKPHDIEEVVAYVASLRGSNPANPKAPQGVETPP